MNGGGERREARNEKRKDHNEYLGSARTLLRETTREPLGESCPLDTERIFFPPKVAPLLTPARAMRREAKGPRIPEAPIAYQCPREFIVRSGKGEMGLPAKVQRGTAYLYARVDDEG